MDEHRHKILVILVSTMAMHGVIAQVIALQQVAIGQIWNDQSNLNTIFCKRQFSYLL
jgi:hypothetical protein